MVYKFLFLCILPPLYTNNTFNALDKTPNISFIDTPEDIIDKYQYFTQSNMQKLRSIGYQNLFTTLENGVEDYVRFYLIKGEYY